MQLVTVPVVDFSDLSAITVTGCTTDAWYVLMITMDDGNVTWIAFTAEVPAAE